MSQKNIYKEIYLLIKPYRGLLIITMACLVLVAGLSGAQAYMVKPLLDKIFFEKNQEMLLLLPLALLILFVVKGVFAYLSSYMMDYIGFSIIKNLRVRLYGHIICQPLSFLQKTSTGEIISRIMNDVSLLQHAVSSSVVSLLRDFFKVIGLLGYIFYQDWKLSLISLTLLPVAVVFIVNFGRKFRRYSTSCQQESAEATTILHETISGNRIVKAFCMEKYEKNHFADSLDRLFSFMLKDSKLRSFSRPFMEILGGLGIAAIMWYGGSQVLNGHSSPGTFFSFLTALVMIYEPIKSLSGINNTLQQGMAAAVRIYGILEIKSEASEQPDAIELPPIKEKITFKDVCFGYDQGPDVLKNINLTVRADEILALVGTSGGGKTTLVNLIPRFYNITHGRIFIDNVDIKGVSLNSLRSQIGIVTQETILFNDTVRNNIAYGDTDRSEEEIIAAARAAYAFDFINELPEGFDTVIGESGSRLSGGQRQRISIARALLKNAPILILDEATSALDTESEYEVQKALENLMQNRTTFVIAHRLSTIKDAHRIIVMQDGQIVEEGTHEALLEQGGVYEKLHSMQA